MRALTFPWSVIVRGTFSLMGPVIGWDTAWGVGGSSTSSRVAHFVPLFFAVMSKLGGARYTACLPERRLQQPFRSRAKRLGVIRVASGVEQGCRAKLAAVVSGGLYANRDREEPRSLLGFWGFHMVSFSVCSFQK